MKRGISFDGVWEIKSMHKPYALTSHPTTLPQNGALEIGCWSLESGDSGVKPRRLRSSQTGDSGLDSGQHSRALWWVDRSLVRSLARRLRPVGDSGAHSPETPGGPETPAFMDRRLRSK